MIPGGWGGEGVAVVVVVVAAVEGTRELLFLGARVQLLYTD
jgi:hypothetical protein